MDSNAFILLWKKKKKKSHRYFFEIITKNESVLWKTSIKNEKIVSTFCNLATRATCK